MANYYKFFVSVEYLTYPQNVVMRIVSGQSNCGVGAGAGGVTIIAVTAVIRAIILGLITVKCLVMLLISKSALTASLPLSSRAQR